MSFDRQELLEKVMHLFWERGFEALSFNEISQETGLTRASLYNCFGSKEALFEEAMDLYFRTSPDAKLECLPEDQSVAQAFFNLFEEASTLRAQDPKARGCMAANCINELAASNSSLGDKLRRRFDHKKAVLQRLLERAIRQGELPVHSDPVTLAALMMTFMAGFSTFSKTTNNETTMRQVCELFLHQLGFSRPKP